MAGPSAANQTMNNTEMGHPLWMAEQMDRVTIKWVPLTNSTTPRLLPPNMKKNENNNKAHIIISQLQTLLAVQCDF